jgi:mannose/fructose-specific phosphotransferase system component IIA
MWHLAQAHLPALEQFPIKPVFYELDELERDLYRQLKEATGDLDEQDGILVIGECLGNKGATLSLSIDHPHVVYVSGVNLDLLKSLTRINQYSEPFQNHDVTELLSILADFLKNEASKGILSSNDFVREAGEGSTVDFSTFDSDFT